VDLARVRHAYETLLSHDHFDILQALLGEPLTVEQFADKLARTEERRRLGETLRRLREFVDSCGGGAASSSSEETSATLSERS
jgi:hypothetical protein